MSRAGDSHIKVQCSRGIGEITIDRPQRHNALDVRTARDLRRAGLALCRDEEVRVVVLRGARGVFCSGADLRYVLDGGDADATGNIGYLGNPGNRHDSKDYREPSRGAALKQILEYLHSTIHEIRRAPKPVVAAIDGVAAAGGLGIALCCDLVVASERSQLEFAYFKTGLTGAESVTFFLPRLLGFRRAMDFALLGDRIDARRAQQLGLLSRVFADDYFEEGLADLVEGLAAGPTRAYAASKRLLNEASGMDRIDEHLARELDTLVEIADGPDFAEGLNAFFAKRRPHFKQVGSG
jgi:2-(1,2-epoxy-1,2-dihydrophenyl)acetyl-CoA isomerase